MYHCREIPFKAYSSFEALKSAVERYPFKGGKCPHLEETRLNWKPAAHPFEMYLALGNRPLADAEFRTIQFTSRAKVEIGTSPNGAPNCITIWR